MGRRPQLPTSSQQQSHGLLSVNEGNEEVDEEDVDEELARRTGRRYSIASESDEGICCCSCNRSNSWIDNARVKFNNLYVQHCSCDASRWVRRTRRRLRQSWRQWKTWCWGRYQCFYDEEGRHSIYDELTATDRHSLQYASLDDDPTVRPMNRTTTISVEYLKAHDKRPVHLAWSFFTIYVITGVFYFKYFKGESLRDSIFQIINSLSAVSYGNFDPETALEESLTVVFLFVGLGFMGTFVGMIASSRLDFQDDVKKEWYRMQAEAEEDGELPGMTLMQAQMRLARQRIFWNIFRIFLAIAIGTLVLTPVEHWGWGYAVYFSCQMIMGAGWVDVMPATEVGNWFTLVYALVGSLLIYHALGDLASIPLALRQSKFEAEVLSQWGENLTEDKLQSLSRRASEIAAPSPPQRTGSKRQNSQSSAEEKHQHPSNPPTLTWASSVGSSSYSSNHNGSSSVVGTSTATSTFTTNAAAQPPVVCRSASESSTSSSTSTNGGGEGKVNGNGDVKRHKVTREEFVISMMLLLGRVDMSHVREAQRVFDNLDKDKTGVLNESDVIKHVDQETGLKYRTYNHHRQHSPHNSYSKPSSSSGAGGGKGGSGSMEAKAGGGAAKQS